MIHDVEKNDDEVHGVYSDASTKQSNNVLAPPPPVQSVRFINRIQDAPSSISSSLEFGAAEENKNNGKNCASLSSSSVHVNESFASDAIGSGDVAEAMGAAFDLVASYIDDMLSDQRNESLEEASAHSTGDMDDEDEVEDALILKSTNPDEKEEEWDLVSSSNKSNSPHHNSHDNEFSRATEMIGSALFESDMAQSFSAPPSRVTREQRQRWAVHLSQLAELGFVDEFQNVEIMESLEASYIGSDLMDEQVSVTQVVHELLKLV
jgi:hypothetical protein